MVKTALGFALLCLGLFLSFGDRFLALWAWAAHGRPDILARGPFLLFLYTPYFAVAVALITVGIAIISAAKRQGRPLPTAAVALGAVVLTYLALYLDATAAVWRLRGALHLALGATGYVVLDVLLLMFGGWVLVRHPWSRPRRSPAV